MRGFVLQVKVAATIESVVDASASAKLVRVRVVRPIDVGVEMQVGWSCTHAYGQVWAPVYPPSARY